MWVFYFFYDIVKGINVNQTKENEKEENECKN